MGGKIINIYERVISKDKFKTSPFRKVIEIIFILGLKNKDEGNAIMQ